MDNNEAFDEFPDLTRFLRYITDERLLFNAAVHGTVPEEWQRMLQRASVYARRAAQEVGLSHGAYDDIIKPVWDEDGVWTQRMSGDAYLDLLRLAGEDVEPDVYRDPPEV